MSRGLGSSPTFWLRLIAKVGRVGIDLRDLEDWLVKEYGLSLPMARYYVRKLKAEKLVRYKRPYSRSKKIRVEPTGKLLKLLGEVMESFTL